MALSRSDKAEQALANLQLHTEVLEEALADIEELGERYFIPTSNPKFDPTHPKAPVPTSKDRNLIRMAPHIIGNLMLLFVWLLFGFVFVGLPVALIILLAGS